MSTVEEVLSGVPLKTEVLEATASARVAGLAYDSRKVKKDFLFFAFPGKHVDGRGFARQALEQGALAVVTDAPRPDDFSGAWIEVEHGRRALAVAARNFFGRPDERLAIVGITGTNGKTTTSYIIDSILRAARKTTGLLGTIEYRLGGKAVPAVNTTPESLDLFQFFADLEKAGGTHATMEVSSHALALGRVYGIGFRTAVFTNLTRDHLDFHHTMDEYFEAKRMLFDGAGAPPPPFAVVNHDDAYGRKLRPAGGEGVFSYGIEEGATIRATAIQSGFDGLHFEIAAAEGKFPIAAPLQGRMNVYNILAAWCAARSLGLDPDVIARGIRNCRAVPGRFERVDEGQPFLVMVDYAHTDDALRNVLGVARGLNPKRIITLFGCGGDRDRAKRPLMGEAAAELSDFVVLTSDNPRSEDPLAIINDALVGLWRHDTPHVEEPDRAKAIRLAIQEAQPGDIVVLAGKGHETYQVLKDRTIPLDDREVARQVLRSLGYGARKG
ncbi:MAG TPA: UDP-N-acetylmuramoyl-L-alanyl-D-glutamate--2,6-diaminopimelate ligase [Bryobacteraceae bacterium]|nr:UDP-N-acetylmuramoyl-L-alanyl-D-glutamate--2,6-diaminopimelate ligase [Bryobacteraceae bacterium]